MPSVEPRALQDAISNQHRLTSLSLSLGLQMAQSGYPKNVVAFPNLHRLQVHNIESLEDGKFVVKLLSKNQSPRNIDLSLRMEFMPVSGIREHWETPRTKCQTEMLGLLEHRKLTSLSLERFCFFENIIGVFKQPTIEHLSIRRCGGVSKPEEFMFTYI